MASRNELAVRARNVGLDHTAYANDSKLEQKVLWLEKNGTTFAGTAATGVLTSNNTNNANNDVVTIGSQTYTFKTALSAAAASSTLTSTGTTPTTGDSVTVDGQTYTFRTALTNSGTAPYEVLINGSAANALINLKKAINASGVAGTDYGVGTAANPTVSAGTITTTTLVVSARTVGTNGNRLLTSTVNAGTLSWTGTNLSGGVNNVAGEIFIGASADASLTNLVSAINGAGTPGTDYDATTPVNANVTAGAVAVHATTLTARNFAGATNADVATTKTAATLTWGAATLSGGVLKQIAVDTTTVNGSGGLSGDKNV